MFGRRGFLPGGDRHNTELSGQTGVVVRSVPTKSEWQRIVLYVQNSISADQMAALQNAQFTCLDLFILTRYVYTVLRNSFYYRCLSFEQNKTNTVVSTVVLLYCVG